MDDTEILINKNTLGQFVQEQQNAQNALLLEGQALYGLPVEEVARQTRENALRIYPKAAK